MGRISALFAVTLPLVAGCTLADQVKSRDLIREGNAAYADGQFEQAIEKYNASLELEPDGVSVLWNRACAAESLVINLKDATDPKQVSARGEFAELALKDFSGWLDGLEIRDEEQAKTVESHRLALMRADNRCDDLVSYYLQQHREDPQDETQYTRIARIQEDVCGQEDKATEWYRKRVRDFPKSEKAWYALAVRNFTQLFPDGESGLPFNDTIPAEQRLKIADEVIEQLNEATGIRPEYQDPYAYRKMAYIQRQFARVYDETSNEPRDRLQALLARNDSMLAYKEERALCDLNQTPACPVEIDFSEAARTPALFEGQRVVLMGEVVSGSVSRDPSSTATRSVYSISLKTPSPPEAEGDTEAADAKGGTDKDAAQPEVQVVRVRYAFEFVPPAVEEAKEPPAEDETAAEEPAEQVVDPVVAAKQEFESHTAEVVEGWANGKQLTLTGTFKGGVFETKEELPAMCCPPPPISDEDYAADLELKKTLEAEIAALEPKDIDGKENR
jgi:tetratricopeptide (TPR) repeat protein